ncbi:putative glycosidase, partial [Tolypocladium ophioglossoides CBS 100239]
AAARGSLSLSCRDAASDGDPCRRRRIVPGPVQVCPDRLLTSSHQTGSRDGGNTFPGVSRPLGMVKLGPDLHTGRDSYSGYQPTGNFTGFTMLHESGTGGAPKYGVVSQMPVVGNVENPLSDAMNDTRAAPDFTEVGFYKAHLGSGTTLKLAASNRAGMYKYIFPKDKEGFHVLVDVSHVLSSYRGQGLEQHYLGGNITVHKQGADSHYYYTGFGTYDNGWNRAAPWTVYCCGRFDAPATYKTFLGVNKETDKLAEFATEPSYESSSARLGALFSFNQTTVVSRVGVSFMSADQACSNVDGEIPQGTSLKAVRRQTREAWNAEVFGKVTTTSTNTTKLNQLYSALYFMHLLPTNKTGENPLWESPEPYYDDIFTFWDTHRCTTALLHVLQPTYYEELLRSMVDVWRHQGWVSDARSSLSNGAVQGGSNSDNVFADAFSKGVRGKVNWDDAFAAMVKNAEVVPANNYDPRDPTGSTKEGRSALPDWLAHGFITPRFSRSVSRAVEYSVNDFSLAVVAAGLGHLADFAKYFDRSHNWRNHWNPNMTALGFSGFVGPRDAGGFLEQDPLSCGGCYWRDCYYQALPWEYSFNAHHDLAHLVELCGGAARFVERLDMTFKPGVFEGNAPFGHTLFNPGNEPSFTTPYLYNYVNRQDLTVKRSRAVAKSYYAPTPSGLPGNSDAGAMESWLLWNMLGLYPMTGQPVFLIGSPWFDDLTIDLGAGRNLHVTTTGGAEQAFYVQSLKVNGVPWNRSWLTWYDVFARGGTLEFELGSKPTNWTTGPPPPSLASLAPDEAGNTLGDMRG